MIKLKDLTGQKFGKLTVIPGVKHCFSGNRKRGMYNCECECGKIVYVRADNLKSGSITSCGCARKRNWDFIEKKDCLLIPLPHGLFASIDKVDRELVKNLVWCNSKQGYVVANQSGRVVKLHRLILGINGYTNIFCDHKDLDKLNNKRKNLRIATITENNRNRKIMKRNKTGYIGVQCCGDKFQSLIGTDFGSKYIGVFETKIMAAIARDISALKYHKEFAVFNFPEKINEHKAILESQELKNEQLDLFNNNSSVINAERSDASMDLVINRLRRF